MLLSRVTPSDAPYQGNIRAMRRIDSSVERIFTHWEGYGNLLIHDLAVGILAAAELLQLLHGHQHVAGLGALRGADHAPLLELVHDPPGPGEPDLHLGLEHRGGAEPAAEHDLPRLRQYRADVAVGVHSSSADLGDYP